MHQSDDSEINARLKFVQNSLFELHKVVFWCPHKLIGPMSTRYMLTVSDANYDHSTLLVCKGRHILCEISERRLNRCCVDKFLELGGFVLKRLAGVSFQ